MMEPNLFASLWWRTLKLRNRLKCESKGENDGRRKSWGMFPNSQHFEEGKEACWISETKTRMSDSKSIIHTVG
jgi:hypothetical protein